MKLSLLFEADEADRRVERSLGLDVEAGHEEALRRYRRGGLSLESARFAATIEYGPALRILDDLGVEYKKTFGDRNRLWRRLSRVVPSVIDLNLISEEQLWELVWGALEFRAGRLGLSRALAYVRQARNLDWTRMGDLYREVENAWYKMAQKARASGSDDLAKAADFYDPFRLILEVYFVWASSQSVHYDYIAEVLMQALGWRGESVDYFRDSLGQLLLRGK